MTGGDMEQIKLAISRQKSDKARVSLLLQMLAGEINNAAGDPAKSKKLSTDLMRLDINEVMKDAEAQGTEAKTE